MIPQHVKSYVRYISLSLLSCIVQSVESNVLTLILNFFLALLLSFYHLSNFQVSDLLAKDFRSADVNVIQVTQDKASSPPFDRYLFTYFGAVSSCLDNTFFSCALAAVCSYNIANSERFTIPHFHEN